MAMQVAATKPPAPIRAIAAAAVEDLTPVVVVNRRADVALDQAAAGADRPFTNIHDGPRDDVKTELRHLWRATNERVRGTYGEGRDAGHTVYGSVRFVEQADARDGAEAVLAALREQGDVGVRAYGPVSFVLDEETMHERATFAADDTGITTAAARPPEDIARVVAERIARNEPDDPGPTVDELLALPHAAATDAVRGWLLSDDVGGSTGYMEAQVRRMTNDDVAGIFVETGDPSAVEHRSGVDPGTAPSAEVTAALDAAFDVPVASS